MTILIAFTVQVLVLSGVLLLLLRGGQSLSDAEKRLRSLIRMARGEGPEEPAASLEMQASGTEGWAERLYGDTALVRRLRSLLVSSQVNWSVGQLAGWSSAGLLTLAALGYVFTSNLVIAAAAGVVAPSGMYAYLKLRSSRRLAAFEGVLPDTLDMCARSLRAGHSIAAAIGILSEEAPEPARSEFREVFRKQNYGLPVREALLELLARVPSRDLKIAIAGILVQRETGGNLAEVMDRIVAVIRERMRIQGEIRTNTAQGRLTGWILCLLPPCLFAVISFINQSYAHVLVDDPLGRKLLYGAAGLILLGGLSIRTIIHSIEV